MSGAKGQGGKPRVVVLTYPSLMGAAILRRFEACDAIELVGIGLSARIYRGKGHLESMRLLASRSGWAFTRYGIAMTDVGWALARLCGAPRVLRDPRVSRRRLRNVNAKSSVAWLSELEPDFVVSCFFNQIIGPRVISLPRRGCLNLHAAPLPALRGPEPSFRVLERGLKHTGLTLHRVERGVDEGEILHQEARQVPEGISLAMLDFRAWSDGAALAADWISGRCEAQRPRSQAGAPTDYDTWPTSDEVQRLQENTARLWSARDFLRCLREVTGSGQAEGLPPSALNVEEVAARAVAARCSRPVDVVLREVAARR